MKAVIMPKISNSVRNNLKDVVPLKVPYSIMIDIADICNFNCVFCFHSDKKAIKESGVRFGTMSLEMFRNIIDSIRKDWGGKC
jgi:sulfatase maturation enzyme AslB (radical SAM superfamily)